jgi:hypothetical protein
MSGVEWSKVEKRGKKARISSLPVYVARQDVGWGEVAAEVQECFGAIIQHGSTRRAG